MLAFVQNAFIKKYHSTVSTVMRRVNPIPENISLLLYENKSPNPN